MTPDDIAELFAGKHHGWKPSPIKCASIGGQLDWLFRPAAVAPGPQPPKPPTTKAATNAAALRKAIPAIVSYLQATVDYHEQHTHKQIGADPNRNTIDVLNDLDHRLRSLRPIFENQKKPRATDSWRKTARAIYQILEWEAKDDKPAHGLSINGESHVAEVVLYLLIRAGFDKRSKAAVAEACTDPKLTRVLRQARSYPATLWD